ncbi:hypothetical protein BDY21DRAFT_355777 [Lineolata rhizophorae]|uniref:Secreted protein n=1 Tax=Lineolata rhizophorae TaxID=578093 RepID=A0A6A6NPG9_9PEZI|nr:hypothetical protein BDY21DRAFT_355777 [Lineolata rhizophorae]
MCVCLCVCVYLLFQSRQADRGKKKEKRKREKKRGQGNHALRCACVNEGERAVSGAVPRARGDWPRLRAQGPTCALRVRSGSCCGAPSSSRGGGLKRKEI